MHIHAAALDAKVAAALASANAQHIIPQDTFVQLPGQFAGVGSVWVAWRAGDATSATPFAGRLVNQDLAQAAFLKAVVSLSARRMLISSAAAWAQWAGG